jgi:hypothetical protein
VDYFLLPTLPDYDATSPADCWANPGKGFFWSTNFVEANKDFTTDFLKFFMNNVGQIANDKGYLCGIRAPNTEIKSSFYQKLYDNFAAVDEQKYARCWDVVIDEVSNEVLKAQAVNLALGEISSEEFCNIMDDTIARMLANKNLACGDAK